MNYKQALEYLQELDTTLFRDPQLTAVIHKAQDALVDCLELGLTGDDEETTAFVPSSTLIRWEKVSTTHVVLDPKTGECETTKEVHHEQVH